MQRAVRTKPIGRLAVAIAILAGLLPLAGVGTAAAEEHEAPFITAALSNAPNQITVAWFHEEEGVYGYAIQLKLGDQWQDAQRMDHTFGEFTLAGLEPETWYALRVCAVYDPDGAERECSEPEWNVQTQAAEQPQEQQRPPAPRIVSHDAGENWIGIRWEAGNDYDLYFINYREKDAPLSTIRTLSHDHDGTQGYRVIDGLLPNKTYSFAVQGCTEAWFGLLDDNCWDWSGEHDAKTLPPALASGPDTCLQGYVWREAFDGDIVCVTPERRGQVAADNAQANARRAHYSGPESGFVVPDTCKQGWVWREARPDDHVCVTPAERDTVAAENATANERRAATYATSAPPQVPAPLPEKPATPTNFEGQRDGGFGTRIILSWRDSSDEEYYFLTAFSAASGEQVGPLAAPAPMLGANSTTFIVTGDFAALVGGIEFRLQACNPGGCSAPARVVVQ